MPLAVRADSSLRNIIGLGPPRRVRDRASLTPCSDDERVAKCGEIPGQHRDSTGCAFATFPTHLTHGFKPNPHGYEG